MTAAQSFDPSQLRGNADHIAFAKPKTLALSDANFDIESRLNK